jgi:hypothetical protein
MKMIYKVLTNRELYKFRLCSLAISTLILFGFSIMFSSCKGEPDPLMPEISLVFEDGLTNDGDIALVGAPLKFKIVVNGPEANITNFTVKKEFNGTLKTVMDSGLNSAGFTLNKTFYQSVEDETIWVFAVQDRNKNTAQVSLKINKDPNSEFGGIIEYPEIILGYQDNSEMPHFFLPSTGDSYGQDSASLFQVLVDVLVYFNYREDNGVLLPSPTFSSPAEEESATGDLYDLYYTYISGWTTRNYTMWDIRADNGVSADDFENAHNDSLLIVSFDDVWGKKKYKWANEGVIIPFITADGKKGIVKVLNSENSENGTISFAMKIQL